MSARGPHNRRQWNAILANLGDLGKGHFVAVCPSCERSMILSRLLGIACQCGK
jgi:hypothetical protein